MGLWTSACLSVSKEDLYELEDETSLHLTNSRPAPGKQDHDPKKSVLLFFDDDVLEGSFVGELKTGGTNVEITVRYAGPTVELLPSARLTILTDYVVLVRNAQDEKGHPLEPTAQQKKLPIQIPFRTRETNASAFENVQDIFSQKCAVPSCHAGPSMSAPMSLEA